MGDVTSPDNTEAPKRPLMTRPGGPHYPRPVEIGGKTFDPFHPPKSVQNPDGTQEFIGGKELPTKGEEKLLGDSLGLDVARLKKICERCTAKYEGKYQNGLLDINVVLDADDRTEVGKLIGMAERVHAEFADGNPDWKKFVGLREEMRSIYGTLGENARIIEDNSVQTPTKVQTENNIVVIRVPTSIYRLGFWDSKIGDLNRQFDHYDKGFARGQMAAYLGEGIREVYRFVKTSQVSGGQR